MTATTHAAALGVVGGVVLFPVFIGAAWWHAGRRTAKGIVRRIQRPGSQHTVRVGYTNATWNPEKSGIDALLYERGTATYTLDADGRVHMRFVPKKGAPHDYAGPVPPGLARGTSAPKRRHTVARFVIAVFAAAAVVGFILGYVYGSGDTVQRLAIGAVAAVGGMAVCWLAMHVLAIGLSIRKVVSSDQTRSPASTTGPPLQG